MLREIANDFYMNQNYNCGECILRAANKAYDLGLDERGLKLASGFGAGHGLRQYMRCPFCCYVCP